MDNFISYIFILRCSFIFVICVFHVNMSCIGIAFDVNASCIVTILTTLGHFEFFLAIQLLMLMFVLMLTIT